MRCIGATHDQSPNNILALGDFFMTGNDLLTTKQTCELTGLSHTTIHRLRRDNDFPIPIRLGRAGVRFKRDEVEAWLENRPRVNEGRKCKTSIA